MQCNYIIGFIRRCVQVMLLCLHVLLLPEWRVMLGRLTLMASMAYSTWNSLPSGEKVFTPLQKKKITHSIYSCKTTPPPKTQFPLTPTPMSKLGAVLPITTSVVCPSQVCICDVNFLLVLLGNSSTQITTT